MRLTESDSGIDLSQGNVCPTCGAQNNGDQTRCWQCESILLQNHPRGHLTPVDSERSRSRKLEADKRRPPDERFFRAASALLLLAAGAGGIAIFRELRDPMPAPTSFTDFFQHQMLLSRLVVGVLLIVISPFLLGLTLRILAIRPRCTGNRILLTGLIPPALSFTLSWLPPQVLGIAVLAPAAVAWLLLQRGLALPLQKAVGTWGIHGFSLALVASGALLALESIQTGRFLNPSREISALKEVAQKPRGGEQAVELRNSGMTSIFTWHPSGSEWLDYRGNSAQILVRGIGDSSRHVTLLERDANHTLFEGEVNSDPWRSAVFHPTPGARYALQVSGGEVQGTRVAIRSLLPHVAISQDESVPGN